MLFLSWRFLTPCVAGLIPPKIGQTSCTNYASSHNDIQSPPTADDDAHPNKPSRMIARGGGFGHQIKSTRQPSINVSTAVGAVTPQNSIQYKLTMLAYHNNLSVLLHNTCM